MGRKQRNKPSNTKPLIDIVITTGGRFDMLSKCLDALYREAETTPLSIYIVDNNSPAEERIANEHLFFKRDGTSVIEFRTKRLTQDVGFPDSNNQGARMGVAPLVMFLNDDVELKEGAIQKVIDTFKDETIGVVGIRLLFPPTSTFPVRPPNTIQHVGIAMNIRGEAVHPLVGWNQDNPKTKKSQDTIAVTGACLTIRRSLFQKVGGFGLEFGMGTWEDVDICFKSRQNGLRVYVNCEAEGYHYTGATAEKKKVSFPLQQNRMIFQAKWGNSGLMAWSEPDFL